jgi:tetratricopeptide (TPR) repeat protein
MTSVRQGHYQPAETRLREALARFRASGNRHGETQASVCLGELELRCGRYPHARKNLEHAIAICDQTGDLADRAEALNLLGEIFCAAGDPAQARARHHDALALARRLGDPYQQAHAHRGLGNAKAAAGHQPEAGQHWEQALARYAELGTPEADQLRAQLAAASPASMRPRRSSRGLSNVSSRVRRLSSAVMRRGAASAPAAPQACADGAVGRVLSSANCCGARCR